MLVPAAGTAAAPSNSRASNKDTLVPAAGTAAAPRNASASSNIAKHVFLGRNKDYVTKSGYGVLDEAFGQQPSDQGDSCHQDARLQEPSVERTLRGESRDGFRCQ